MESKIRDHAAEFMDEDEAIKLENSLWWNVGRSHIISTYMGYICRLVKIRKIMDLGCGSGSNFQVLSQFGTVIGIDRSPILAKRARSRRIAEYVHEGDVFGIDDVENVNVFTLFDVLEHIEDDFGFVRKLKSISSNHYVLISVPACPFLYSEHDRILHHQRRYSRNMIKDLLAENNYKIVAINYHMFFLFPLVMLARLKEKVAALFGRKSAELSLGVVPDWLNRIFTRVLRSETNLSSHLLFPIGLWLFVLAKREPCEEDNNDSVECDEI